MVEYYYSTSEKKSDEQKRLTDLALEVIHILWQKCDVRRNAEFEFFARVNSDYFSQIRTVLSKYFVFYQCPLIITVQSTH